MTRSKKKPTNTEDRILSEIKKYQSTTELIIGSEVFQKLVLEILKEQKKPI